MMAVEIAAKALVDAMETCHICQGLLLVSEGPAHCEDCPYDCDDHEEPECQSIYQLHLNLKRALQSANAGKPQPVETPDESADVKGESNV